MEQRFELYFRINEQRKWVEFSIYFLGHKIDFYQSKKTKNFSAVIDVYVKNELLYGNPYAKNMNSERDVRKGAWS